MVVKGYRWSKQITRSRVRTPLWENLNFSITYSNANFNVLIQFSIYLFNFSVFFSVNLYFSDTNSNYSRNPVKFQLFTTQKMTIRPATTAIFYQQGLKYKLWGGYKLLSIIIFNYYLKAINRICFNYWIGKLLQFIIYSVTEKNPSNI